MIVHWSFNPIVFSLGPVAVRWYGLLFVGAFWAGQTIVARMFAAEGADPKRAETLFLYALIGTIVGARLAHCLAYDPGYYLANPVEILKIWKGGLASHGGVIGMLLGLWLGARASLPKLSYLWLLDRVTIPAALGAVFVRVANFLNSEIVGLPTSGGYGVVFEAVDTLPRHPVQLYEAVAYLLITVLLVSMYLRADRRPPAGRLFGTFMLLVFSARIALEFFKVPQAAYESGHLFTVGQYLSVPFVLLGAWMIVRSRKASS